MQQHLANKREALAALALANATTTATTATVGINGEVTPTTTPTITGTATTAAAAAAGAGASTAKPPTEDPSLYAFTTLSPSFRRALNTGAPLPPCLSEVLLGHTRNVKALQGGGVDPDDQFVPLPQQVTNPNGTVHKSRAPVASVACPSIVAILHLRAALSTPHPPRTLSDTPSDSLYYPYCCFLPLLLFSPPCYIPPN